MLSKILGLEAGISYFVNSLPPQWPVRRFCIIGFEAFDFINQHIIFIGFNIVLSFHSLPDKDV